MPRHANEIPDWTRCTQTQLAGAFGISTQAIRKWSDPPRNKEGSYSLPDVIAWWRERYEAQLGAEDRPSDSAAIEAYRAERARGEKRRNDEAEGLLVSAVDMSRELAEITNVMRQGFEGIEKTHGKRVGLALRRMIDKAEKAWQKMIEGRRA